MRILPASLLVIVVSAVSISQAADPSGDTLPKIVLVGDSIRLSYASAVTKQLAGRAIVVSSKANGGDSNNVLKHLESWVIREGPTVVHFNCGVHDTKKFKATNQFQVSPEQYEANLRTIVQRIRAKTKAVVLFGTTTPIINARAASTRRDRDYELLDASVRQYNTIATRVMRELHVPVNDLHVALSDAATAPLASLVGADGVHLTPSARELLGKRVAGFVSSHLPDESGPWHLSAWQKPPAVTWLDRSSPIRSLTYKSELFEGAQTDVFAFYATPGSISGDEALDKNLPAVVLIHGGGGTAFAEWTWLWAKRGYAAIAMDLSGRRPAAPKFDAKTGELLVDRKAPRTRLKHGGPEANHTAKFQNVGGQVTDDWQYHAVAAVTRAHSLVRSFPEVDEDRTAVTGISWGGYMTCLVASIDNRFKAAVPVYGCGYLYEGESVQKRLIDELGPEQRAEWIRVYDPSAWLPRCRVPMLFVNGAKDKHYPLTSYDRSYDLVPGLKQMRIEVNMRHSHVHGWAPIEIGLFIDHFAKGGAPLPSISRPRVDANKVKATLTSVLPLKRAELHYTSDTGPLVARRWTTIEANIDDASVTGTIPDNATIWLLSVTDSRDAMVSSEPFFRKK